jgi:hypothetical protein
MMTVVMLMTAVSVVVPVSVPVSETVMLMAMEVGEQLSERHWRGLLEGCAHIPPAENKSRT